MLEQLQVAPIACIIFALTIATSVWALYDHNALNNMVLHPYTVSRKKRIYTLITSGFIHTDWMHLFFNMFSFYAFAFTLEQIIGHWQFAVLYMVSMVLGDLPSVYKHRDDYGYRTLGASGAISAVVFSAILFQPKMGMMILPIPFEIPAYIFGVLYLAYCSYSSKYGRDNINHDAHLYGALSGVIITIAMFPEVVSLFIAQFTGQVHL